MVLHTLLRAPLVYVPLGRRVRRISLNHPPSNAYAYMAEGSVLARQPPPQLVFLRLSSTSSSSSFCRSSRMLLRQLLTKLISFSCILLLIYKGALDVVFEGRQHPRSCLILAWPECRADLSPRSTNTTPRCNGIDPCFEPNIYTWYIIPPTVRVLIVFGIVFFTLLQDTTACHLPDAERLRGAARASLR